MKHYFLIFFLFICLTTVAKSQQKETNIQFSIVLDDIAIELGKTYYSPSIRDSIEFESVKFYLSDLQFFKNDTFVSSLDQKYFLIDLENPNSQQISLSSKAFNKVKFKIGIDSTTSVSGAFGGDLDPTNGMYWTWQSGYINVKIEGNTPISPARHNRFQFHLGGYQFPFNSLQTVELTISQNQSLKIQIAMDQLLAKIDLAKNFNIMSPSKKSMQMTSLFSTIFSIVE